MWTAYLAIGDSTTAGFGDSVDGVECRSWTDWVAGGLTSVMPELRYRNIGCNGATATAILHSQVPFIEQFRPDLVSITAGANDALLPTWRTASFRADYTSILLSAAKAGAQIVTATYTDIRLALDRAGRSVPWLWLPYYERMWELNEVIREVSTRFGACLLDMGSFDDAEDLRYRSGDFTHPNALGYRMAGEAALALLENRFDLPQLALGTRRSD